MYKLLQQAELVRQHKHPAYIAHIYLYIESAFSGISFDLIKCIIYDWKLRTVVFRIHL